MMLYPADSIYIPSKPDFVHNVFLKSRGDRCIRIRTLNTTTLKQSDVMEYENSFLSSFDYERNISLVGKVNHHLTSQIKIHFHDNGKSVFKEFDHYSQFFFHEGRAACIEGNELIGYDYVRDSMWMTKLKDSFKSVFFPLSMDSTIIFSTLMSKIALDTASNVITKISEKRHCFGQVIGDCRLVDISIGSDGTFVTTLLNGVVRKGFKIQRNIGDVCKISSCSPVHNNVLTDHITSLGIKKTHFYNVRREQMSVELVLSNSVPTNSAYVYLGNIPGVILPIYSTDKQEIISFVM